MGVILGQGAAVSDFDSTWDNSVELRQHQRLAGLSVCDRAAWRVREVQGGRWEARAEALCRGALPSRPGAGSRPALT